MQDTKDNEYRDKFRKLIISQDSAVAKAKEGRKEKILIAGRIISWILFVLVLMAIISGYLWGGAESGSLPVSFHIIISTVVILFLAYHVFVYIFVIRYNWMGGILSALIKKGRGLAGLIFILRVSGLILLVSGLFVILSGFHHYIIPGDSILFSNHVIAGNIFFIAFSVHMAAGLKLVLVRLNKSLFLQNALSLIFFLLLMITFLAFEFGLVF